jgi:hypothetical protein
MLWMLWMVEALAAAVQLAEAAALVLWGRLCQLLEAAQPQQHQVQMQMTG